jgi:molecular chaperone GrpE
MKKEKENYKDLKENESEEIKNSGSDKVPETEPTEDLNQKIIELEKELNEYKDRLLRKAAEFENYKRRTENDQLNLFKYAAESFIMKLLPVIDDFERSLQYIDSSKDIESIKQGILLVYDKFSKLLEDQGVKKIESVGKPFDVHYHEALLQRTVDDQEPHIVLEELESGYMYKDRVIRHSKVIVSDDASGSNRIKEK